MFVTSALNTASGSPPHVRGKESNGKPSELVSRITPACAGKRYILYFSHDFAWDHPRMCGEKPLGLAPAGWPSGSPPHVRGKERSAYYFACFVGITPAYAGKSFEEHGFVIGVWDHPRVCGEKFLPAPTALSIAGSPPRMRGKGVQCGFFEDAPGITPAYAGKRNGRPVAGSRAMGSPPRMRGKVPKYQVFHLAAGITPAYAGKRNVLGYRLLLHRDHPRVCGEKSCSRRISRSRAGSPPRMRGKDGVCDDRDVNIGITPAYAGKRGPVRLAARAAKDHPRVCGEKRDSAPIPASVEGSPPRMRGKATRSSAAG